MKLLLSLFVTTQLLASSSVNAAEVTRSLHDESGESSSKPTKSGNASGTVKSPKAGRKLPEIGSLMDKAFPMWKIDDNGNRVEEKPCTVKSCEWNPYYITKRYDGLHPDFGGHPTDIDVKYAFYYGSPFGGQPFAGSPHHCSINALDTVTPADCPKIETLNDSGVYGPGHVPPHISLAALTWAVKGKLKKKKLQEFFDYDLYQCRVVPDVLFGKIREYFPRVDGEKVDYPSPITPEGGDFQYEFPSGNGPPHWCTIAYLDTGNWDGFCPYVFEGPDAGKYRHPHIAYAALEVYLAKKAMPKKCGRTWLQNNPDFLESSRVETNTPFPSMSGDSNDPKTVAHWEGQPVIPYTYNSGDSRSFEGNFATHLLFKSEEIPM